MAAFLGRKVIISSFILLRKARLGSKLGDSGPRNPSYMGLKLIQGLKIQDGRHILYNTPFVWLINGSRVLILSESDLIRQRNPNVK